MENKIKASELFIKLILNSQYSMASEDDQVINRMLENHKKIDSYTKKILSDITINNEYMRISMLKTTVLTLIELGIIENDVNLLDIKESNKLVSQAMEIHKKRREQKNN